ISEDTDEDGKPDVFQIESGAAGVFVPVLEAECGAEGAAGGDHDLYCGEIFRADGHAAGHAEHASDAGQRIGRAHFSDCAEVSRWGREGDEALASLRAGVVPGGDIVLESTPNGAGGLFYEEWQRAE